MRSKFLAIVILGATATAGLAELRPVPRDEAQVVIDGKVKKIATKTKEFGGDGVSTSYTADVEVTRVQKGKDVSVGDTIKVRWFAVTKKPSKPIVGAFGHAYKLKETEKATFWLEGSARTGFDIIYNRDGVEKLKK